jgi:hypothetical protein
MGRPFDHRGGAERWNRIRPRRPSTGSRFVSPLLSWATLVALLVTGCGVLSPEEQLLTDFFEASRLHDTATVSRMSTVTFNPRTDGIVQSFEVGDATDEGESRRVRVRATVRQPDGAVAERMLQFVLVRKGGRWLITSIDEDR